MCSKKAFKLQNLKTPLKREKTICLNRISDEDEEWLDNAGNTVDEAVLDLLENASDYEHGLAQLTAQQKILVEN